MALQLILGGSGSGKTSYLYETIIRESMEFPDRPYLILVPEQFTMQTQKDIVTRHPRHGTMNIDILSFERLAYRVFEELATENLEVLDDMGKSMVLRKVAASRQKELVLFSGHLNQTGFINQLKSMLSEFYQYGITPEILRGMMNQTDRPLLKQKISDFAVLFQAFQEYIGGHYITTEEVLDVLCRVVPQSELLAGSVVALDGYTGFTPVQYRLLELFLVHCPRVLVTVTADARAEIYRPLGIQNLFYMSSRMVRHLTKLAKERRVEKLEDIWMKGRPAFRFLESAELDYLEQNLFRYRRDQYEEPMSGQIRLCPAANPAAEVGMIAREIQKLIQEEGLRYRDIAVVTGDLAGYGKEISNQFQAQGIPFFMDDKKTVLENPLVEMIRAALETVRRDFSYETVFRYLRSGLAAGEEEQTDRMENYVLALGIRGYRRWKEEWTYVYRGGKALNLVEMNAYRDRVMEPLFVLKEAFGKKDITIAEMADGVKALLEHSHARERLETLQAYFSEIGEYRLAKEYEQIYELVTGLLDRVAGLLGGEQVSRKEFIDILDAGFQELSVGVIPAVVDRVVVGDLTRTRLAHLKALFFAGVNDGIVPARKDGGKLLTDQEREFFASQELELAPTLREDSFIQRFYLYLMMTKPERYLILSWSAVGADGKSRRSSYLVGELQKLFPKLLPEPEAERNLEALYSAPEARAALIDGLRRFAGMETDEERGRFLELYHWFFASETYREEIRRLVDAAFYAYDRQGIGRAAARALYGTIVSGSVTRLEQYAACAYAHFLKYGLELTERQRYELKAADLGNLFHDSIDRCFQTMKETGGDWRTLTDEARTALVRQCVEQVTKDYGNTILHSSSRNAYLARRVEHITQRTVWALQQQMLRGDFVPAGFEVSFSAADQLKAMKITLSEDEAIHLRGRIDRMDLCEEEQYVYVKIIDYKSGSTSFDLAALYYGLQLQLVVYMDAVLEMTKRSYPDKEAVPAGILYYHINDPLIEKEGEPDPEEIQQEILKKLRMNGLVNSELEVIRHMDREIQKESDIIPVVLKGDEVQEAKSSVANRERFESLRKFVHEKVKAAGREILDGEIAAAPYQSGGRTACDYCPYHAVCGFDKKTAGYEYRKLKNKKTEEIWEEICQ